MESLPTATELAVQAHDFSLWGLFMQAGVFVKLVMLLLLVMSIMTWAIWIHKYRIYRKLRRQADAFEQAFHNNEKLAELYKNTTPETAEHPMVGLFVTGVREWEKVQDKETPSGLSNAAPVERIRQLLAVTYNREMDKLESNLSTLATIGSTAPFIGLLGTVWGIMGSFQSIGAAKNTSLAVVAPGIAEALLATAIGLFAAIPAVMAYNKLSNEAGRYGSRLEGFITHFLSRVENEVQRRVNAARAGTKKRRATDPIDDLFSKTA